MQLLYFTTCAAVSEHPLKFILAADQSGLLHEFFSPTETLFLKGKGSAALDIHFLPFYQEKRYCTVILVNEKVRIKCSVFIMSGKNQDFCQLCVSRVNENSAVKRDLVFPITGKCLLSFYTVRII